RDSIDGPKVLLIMSSNLRREHIAAHVPRGSPMTYVPSCAQRSPARDESRFDPTRQQGWRNGTPFEGAVPGGGSALTRGLAARLTTGFVFVTGFELGVSVAVTVA